MSKSKSPSSSHEEKRKERRRHRSPSPKRLKKDKERKQNRKNDEPTERSRSKSYEIIKERNNTRKDIEGRENRYHESNKRYKYDDGYSKERSSKSYDDQPRRYWDEPDKRKPKRSMSKNYEIGSRYYDDPKNKVQEKSEVKNESNIQNSPAIRPKKEINMLTSKTGGAYIPPAKLRMMQAEITDKSSAPYQRISWEALKKSIHGCINKINTGNIGTIIKELLRENIVRGRGLLCRSIIQAQAASPTFTHVYAALVSAINSRFPNIGELLLKRLVIQFKRGFKRNDKAICISAATFVAHLVNQRVAHEILALEILTLLVESPSDDSVEVAIAFLKECGQKLTEVSAKGVNAIFEMLRNILHEGQLDKRVQYMIEVMFQVRKDGFKDHVAVLAELELVSEDDQFTHLIMLDEVTDPQDLLNVFKFDPSYEANEGKYKELSKEILGSDAESNSDEESGSGSDSDSEVEDENQESTQKEGVIIDNTETNLIALRRTIYLTIHSSLDFEECAHKLMKMQLKPGQEMELCHMFLDCCAEQRTYEKFYGLLAQRFCQINRIYVNPFEQIFKDSYGTAHRLDTNRLRNISKFFAHLLFTDAIGWEALDCVKLNEEDTTSSSRIFIKILFQELAEYMGLGKLNERLKDPTLQGVFSGIFPRDNPKNTRFAINFFTSIGLGGLTDELREHLKQAPKLTETQNQLNIPPAADSSSSSSSDSDSDDSSSSSSESSSDSSSSSSDSSSSSESDEKHTRNTKKKHKKKDNPDPRKSKHQNDSQKHNAEDKRNKKYGSHNEKKYSKNDDRREKKGSKEREYKNKNDKSFDDQKKIAKERDYRNKNDKSFDDHKKLSKEREYKHKNDKSSDDQKKIAKERDYKNKNDKSFDDHKKLATERDYKNKNDKNFDDHKKLKDSREKHDNRPKRH